jgi:hypothetical protein
VKFNREHQPTPTHLSDHIGTDAPQAIRRVNAESRATTAPAPQRAIISIPIAAI